MGVRLILTALVFAFAASAAEVKTVSEDRLVLIVGQPEGNPWQLQEPVCVFRGTQRIACGYIETLNETAGRVALTSSSGVAAAVGDRAERVEFTSNVFRVIPKHNTYLITHESNRRWEVGDAACLAREGKVFGCGTVVTIDDTSAGFQLYESNVPPPAVGDEVRRIGGQVAVTKASEEEVSVQQPKNGIWKVGQGVALFKEGRGIATGRIATTTQQEATVHILTYVETAEPGDLVLPIASVPEEPSEQGPAVAAVAPAPAREAASTASAAAPAPAVKVARELKRPEKRPGSMLISVGLFSFLKSLRFLRFEKRIHDRFRLGSLNYVVGGTVPGGDLKGFATYVTGSYQPFNGWLRGMTFQAGFGVLSLEAVTTVNQRAVAPSLAAGVGWRWTWNSGFSVAVAGMDLFSFGSAPALIPKSLPHISTELGVHF